MPFNRVCAALLIWLPVFCQMPLPELRVEATDGGSALRIHNSASQPLTACFIELVGYPGSSYFHYFEGVGGSAISPGAEKRIAITNMTVGAAPEYVKMQAALYADGSSAGPAEKVAQLAGLRRDRLQTIRDLLARLEKGDGNTGLAESLRQWAESIPAPTKRDRGTADAILRAARRELIFGSAARINPSSAELLKDLKAEEAALAASKPPL